ncbi:MAG: methyltransferase domain-containing protein, partial [Polyangiaceae bacterium]|nr:methyltransferase domain-containing protein [Polyangiaceae bacterium]
MAPGDKVLDLACGDGTFSSWLAERAGDSGLVVGLDVSVSCLDRAVLKHRSPRPGFAPTVFTQGDASAI